jgi:CRISPR/Cas system-associated exonuclease Cas4 (RecB family)
MPPIALSKTKVLSFLQCPKRLWLEQYSPELEDEDAFDQAAIETGRVVGAKAREVYGGSGGYLVSHDRGLRAAIAETEALLAAGGTEPIFEATFDHDGVTVQIDVLDRSGAGPRIIEVKSSTSVKDHHLRDCAVQAWTLAQQGVAIAGTSLALISNEFEYAGDGDYSGLFHEVDLTPDVAALAGTIGTVIDAARATLDSLDEPEQAIGPHCRSPFPCPFFEHCSPAQGEYPILGLGGNKEPLYALMLTGASDIRELREDQLSSETQQRIWRQTVSGEACVDAELREFVAALAYPRYYLDFETIAFAIPIWAGTRPYQALPFQWSCHIDEGGGRVRHEEFLDLSGEPPLRQAADALIARLGTSGPIVVYTSYEKRVLNELAARFPELAAPLSALADRLVDLYPIAKAHYYHPEMRGSWSIKAILPTIGAGIDYSNLEEVHDGQAAQAAYLEAIHEDTAPARRDALREALLAYCRLDTEAMLRLVDFFGAGSQ